MNTSRALRVANGVFILWGYQLHAYDRKAKDFRISVLSVIFFLGYLAWYTACVCKYFFDDAFLLVLLEGVSPFLYDCLRIHLLFGIKITVLMLIEAKSIAKASTHLCQAFGNSSSTRFTLTELVVYFILFINPLLNIVLGIYDVSMLRPKHFHADRIMILSAVYLPHFSLACALKYLCIVMWLITQDLITLLVDLQLVLMRSDSKSLVSMITIEEPISMTAFEMTPRQQHDPCPLDRSIDLNRILGRVKTIQLISIEVNRVIQKQLNVLVIISALVFIEASYAFMYYDLVWNEVLIGNFRNAFLATFASFYVFVLMDFIILFMASHILSIKKQKFMDYLDDQLQSSEWNHGVLRLIKDIKTTLKKTPKFKIFFVLDIDWATFLLGGGEFLMAIGFVVIYQYINQKFKIAKFEA